MIQKTVLNYKLKKSKEKMTSRSGLSFFSEFLHALNLPDTTNKIMPKSLSNRGFSAWDYVHSLLLTLYGGGEAIYDTRSLSENKIIFIF